MHKDPLNQERAVNLPILTVSELGAVFHLTETSCVGIFLVGYTGYSASKLSNRSVDGAQKQKYTINFPSDFRIMESTMLVVLRCSLQFCGAETSLTGRCVGKNHKTNDPRHHK